MVAKATRTLIVTLIAVGRLSGCAAEADERPLTERALGVSVVEFPTEQGPAGFDELRADAPAARLVVAERPASGPRPKSSYEPRKSVQSMAPDGSAYEAYCGYPDDPELAQAHDGKGVSNRQFYARHHGASYHAESVFVGRREGGRLNPSLVFPDVGSHTTAPHAFSVDSHGNCHLVVADVNISQGNRLDLYWVIGDPRTAKWGSAFLLEHRGFTSWAHPRSIALGESVHLLWDWVDGSHPEAQPDNGLFHVEWTPRGFGRKVRIASGEILAWDMAMDSKSGLLLAVYSTDEGVYGATRSRDGWWSKPARLLTVSSMALSVEARDGAFLLRTGDGETKEWLVSQS